MGYTNPNAACPQCDSHSRHRGLFLWLRDEYRISDREGIALVFAPERALAPLWQNAAKLRVYKVDIEPTRRVDVQANVMRLPFASEVVDLVWCHHVLEQVVDDGEAMKELRRVLRATSGELIVSVYVGEPGPTVEFGYASKTLSGDRRVFGTDFVDRLTAAGFNATRKVYNLTPAECMKYGIDKEDFYLCTRN
ncbi:MAG: methyltransferase domain-containing protein [Pyrinomonadaceae bacterium]